MHCITEARCGIANLGCSRRTGIPSLAGGMEGGVRHWVASDTLLEQGLRVQINGYNACLLFSPIFRGETQKNLIFSIVLKRAL